jgi:diacylglycerol kinase
LTYYFEIQSTLKIMKRFFRSFKYAFKGIVSAFSGESNCRVQLSVGIVVVLVSAVLGLSPLEWCMILACIGLVISLEMVNSAIEKACDRITRERDDYIRYVKDMAAGAVLWSSIISAVIGAIIFLPKIWQLI